MKYGDLTRGLRALSNAFANEGFDVDAVEIAILRFPTARSESETLRGSAEDKRGELRVEYSQK